MPGDAPRPAGAPQGGAAPPPPARRWPLVALAVAAVVSCWNPIAAPFGLFVGLVTAALAFRAIRRGRAPRTAPAVALALSVIASIASVVVLALTAGGVGVEMGGEPVVKGRSAAELEQVLSEAAGRTRERRERAVQELDAQRGRTTTGAPSPAPSPAGTRRRNGP